MNVSLASSNVSSVAVHVVQEPLVESTWCWTVDIVPPVSVVVPETTGVLSVVGSGEITVKETDGFVASITTDPLPE